MTISNASIAAIAVTSVALIGLFVFWWIYKYKNNNKHNNQKPPSRRTPEKQAVAYDTEKQEVKKLYVPQDVGTDIGKPRVFMTNKGLRTFHVNEFGHPIPDKSKLQAN